MTEQKQEKKKRGLCRQIFKWIGLGLLSLVIIAATFLHAPWKVITLLLIILAACTALPKPARKWFWLSVAAIVLVLIIWVFLPDDNEGWRPYTFDEELAALEAKYAVPDEENAAMIYNKLFEDFDIDSNQPKFFIRSRPSSINEPWLSKDHPETAEWLKTQQSTIEILLQAAKKDKCRFLPISADLFSYGEHMKRLPKMRQCAFLLVSAANNDIAEGRIEQAIDNNFAILQMAKHQFQQPMMVDMLVGIAIESLAANQFNRFVVTGDATEGHLSVIEKALAGVKHDWFSNLRKFIENDRLMTKSLLSMLYQTNSKGKTRLSRNPLAQMGALLKEQSDANEIEDQEAIDFLKSLLYPTYWQKKLVKTGVILEWFFMPSTPQKAAKIIDVSYDRYYAMAKPNFDWKKEPGEFPITSLFSTRARYNYQYLVTLLANMAEGGYYRFHDLYLRAAADNKGGRLIIALRRYKNKTGRWPENLDDIEPTAPAEIFVDPLNNDSFIYKLTADGFTLYSKGKNNIDEEGQYNTEMAPDYTRIKVKEDDELIWPPKGRKTKEENADAEQQ